MQKYDDRFRTINIGKNTGMYERNMKAANEEIFFSF